jgi:hypothetical protein
MINTNINDKVKEQQNFIRTELEEIEKREKIIKQDTEQIIRNNQTIEREMSKLEENNLRLEKLLNEKKMLNDKEMKETKNIILEIDDEITILETEISKGLQSIYEKVMQNGQRIEKICDEEKELNAKVNDIRKNQNNQLEQTRVMSFGIQNKLEENTKSIFNSSQGYQI